MRWPGHIDYCAQCRACDLGQSGVFVIGNIAVTLIQRFGSSLNLNIHFHMLFLDGVYVECLNGAIRFRWVSVPTREELTLLAHTIARRVGRYLEWQWLLERDAETSYLALDTVDEDPMRQLLGHSIMYRVAVGPQAGRKVFTLQTLPACDPAVSEKRLSLTPNGNIRYQLKTP